MRKAILVMDMPKKCGDCPCARITKDAFDNICYLTGSWVDGDGKLRKCPLRPLPDHKIVVPEDAAGAVAVKFGWNNCLNEILKEDEEWT